MHARNEDRAASFFSPASTFVTPLPSHLPSHSLSRTHRPSHQGLGFHRAGPTASPSPHDGATATHESSGRQSVEHPGDISYQYIISLHLVNTPYQCTLHPHHLRTSHLHPFFHFIDTTLRIHPRTYPLLRYYVSCISLFLRNIWRRH